MFFDAFSTFVHFVSILFQLEGMASRKLLTYPNSTLIPLVMERRVWNENVVVQDQFWSKLEENRTKLTFYLNNHPALLAKVPVQSTKLLSWNIKKERAF